MESECVVCKIRQVWDLCNFVNADEDQRQAVLNRTMELLMQRDNKEIMSEISFLIAEDVKQILDLDDPYAELKKESIDKSLAIYPRLKDMVRASKNPLKTAVEICIAGNVIDFGPSASHDIEKAVDEVLGTEKSHFDWGSFKETLAGSNEILFLADNAGETVFDRVLIEEIGKRIIYAVKSGPAMNDALREDANASGLEGLVEIVENGSPTSGTQLGRCSDEFLNLYRNAEMVISKGQANFETLVEEKRRVFFLFKVKCNLLSKKHSIPLNEYVLLDNATIQ